MGRGRGDGQPGLIERVRWGNVARLAALVAGGLLIAVGPHSCGARPPTAVELPAPRASVPPATAPTGPTGPTGGEPLGRTERDPVAARPADAAAGAEAPEAPAPASRPPTARR